MNPAKSNRFGDRTKRGLFCQQGLEDDWDRFMFFEVHPKDAAFLEQIEALVIWTFASLLENDVAISPLRGPRSQIGKQKTRWKLAWTLSGALAGVWQRSKGHMYSQGSESVEHRLELFIF